MQHTRNPFRRSSALHSRARTSGSVWSKRPFKKIWINDEFRMQDVMILESRTGLVFQASMEDISGEISKVAVWNQLLSGILLRFGMHPSFCSSWHATAA